MDKFHYFRHGEVPSKMTQKVRFKTFCNRRSKLYVCISQLIKGRVHINKYHVLAGSYDVSMF